MTLVPEGSPAWLRTASFPQYGGHENKRDHLGLGVIDAQTDVSAAQLARMTADLAAIARVIQFGYFVVQCNDTSPAAPTIMIASMQTGVRLVSYEGDAAPSGFPSAARVGNGSFSMTFSSSYTDEYGVSGAFSVQPGTGDNRGSTGGSCNLYRTSATAIAVEAFSSGDTADADALVSFTVFTG